MKIICLQVILNHQNETTCRGHMTRVAALIACDIIFTSYLQHTGRLWNNKLLRLWSSCFKGDSTNKEPPRHTYLYIHIQYAISYGSAKKHKQPFFFMAFSFNTLISVTTHLTDCTSFISFSSTFITPCVFTFIPTYLFQSFQKFQFLYSLYHFE